MAQLCPYVNRIGASAYPLLTYVKLLLLQQWYVLSDEALEAAVDDRLSFRRFAGIPLSEGVPDHIGLSSSLPGSREAGAGGGLRQAALLELLPAATRARGDR